MKKTKDFNHTRMLYQLQPGDRFKVVRSTAEMIVKYFPDNMHTMAIVQEGDQEKALPKMLPVILLKGY